MKATAKQIAALDSVCMVVLAAKARKIREISDVLFLKSISAT